MSDLAPIIIFAYNRPDMLSQTLEALSKNEKASDSIAYAYCDGPAENCSEYNLKNIERVRAILDACSFFKSLTIIKRNENIGLARSIYSGVSEIMESHGKAIILEDDLIVSSKFLDYMNEGLKRYEFDNRVASIVGYNYPLKFTPSFPETYFLNHSDCWGWASWKRSWKLYDTNADTLLSKIAQKGLKSKFDFNNTYPYYRLLKLTSSGKANSWAIKWYGSTFLANKLSLIPKKSLVRHIGNIGTNIKAENHDFLGSEISEEKIEFFPLEVNENLEARNLLIKHLRKHDRRRISFTTMKYIIKRFIIR